MDKLFVLIVVLLIICFAGLNITNSAATKNNSNAIILNSQTLVILTKRVESLERQLLELGDTTADVQMTQRLDDVENQLTQDFSRVDTEIQSVQRRVAQVRTELFQHTHKKFEAVLALPDIQRSLIIESNRKDKVNAVHSK